MLGLDGEADVSHGASSSKDVASSRLLELRNRASQKGGDHRRGLDGDSSDEEGRVEGPSSRRLSPFGPWPADAGLSNPVDQLTDGGMTPHARRYYDPNPEVKLLHRFKPGGGSDPGSGAFWRDFMFKCRLAWDVFFPQPKPVLKRQAVPRLRGPMGLASLLGGPASGGSAPALYGRSVKQVVLNRLQMVLIADRCGVSPEALLSMKAQTLAALAEVMGPEAGAAAPAAEDMAQLEVQVSALKPSGERVTMTINFSDMIADEQLRDSLEYHYEDEDKFDDDDYFLPGEVDEDRVAEIAEAPAAGRSAVRLAAQTVPVTPPRADAAQQ